MRSRRPIPALPSQVPGSRFVPALAGLAALTVALAAPPARAQAPPDTTSAGRAAGPCAAPEARQFDFWIGSWDVRNFQRNPSTPENPTFYPTGDAVVRVYAALGGCAIVEHWEGELSWGHVRGFSVRAYDPETEQWNLVLNWPLPARPVASFSTLEGRFEHGRGVFFNQRVGADSQVVFNRFLFSDIAGDRYRWDSASSVDSLISWRPQWIMQATRRPPEAEPVDPDQPSFEPPAEPLCPEPEARWLDFTLGLWSGTVEGDPGAQARLVSRAILGGCAVLETLEIETETTSRRALRVRAFDAGTARWVAYHLDAARPRFLRYEGVEAPGAGTGALRFDHAGEGVTLRERWAPGEDGRVVWELFESDDRGRTWRRLEQVRFEPLPPNG